MAVSRRQIRLLFHIRCSCNTRGDRKALSAHRLHQGDAMSVLLISVRIMRIMKLAKLLLRWDFLGLYLQSRQRRYRVYHTCTRGAYGHNLLCEEHVSLSLFFFSANRLADGSMWIAAVPLTGAHRRNRRRHTTSGRLLRCVYPQRASYRSI